MISNINKRTLIFILTGLTAVFFYSLEQGDETLHVPAPSMAGSSRLSELLGGDAGDGFPLALQARDFRFPHDHGPHPEFRNEWWYVTGNLDGEGGERFGYELTLFRFALAPANQTQSGSTWRTNQVYIGHFAVSEVEAEQFHVAQRYSRGAAGLAGAQAAPFRVWLDDWVIEDVGDAEGTWALRAQHDGVAINLDLVSQKQPVLNGQYGLSRKSDEPGNASYYYSMTRLKTEGTLRIQQEEYAVTGMSWLDREWGSSALAQDQVGWDWFALQLSDGSDLMFYNLRKNDGTEDKHSAGTFTDVDGSALYLRNDQVVMEVLETWDSEQGGRYPMAWSLEIPGRNLRLEITPVIENQELITTVRYWEGAVDVRGKSGETDISGRGYVELTGYAE